VALVDFFFYSERCLSDTPAFPAFCMFFFLFLLEPRSTLLLLLLMTALMGLLLWLLMTSSLSLLVLSFNADLELLHSAGGSLL
jgi:hypothetical protein